MTDHRSREFVQIAIRSINAATVYVAGPIRDFHIDTALRALDLATRTDEL